jgi:hypothetical protein
MKKIGFFVCALAAVLALSGCATAPEYYEELTEAEQKQLLHSARVLALKSNAVPEHMKGVFPELNPYQRINYTGNKEGKAIFRWEIYENPANDRRLTQKDINPYWVMVYAAGDLTDPEWKVTHAQETPGLQTAPNTNNNRRQVPRQQRQYQPKQKVRYKR